MFSIYDKAEAENWKSFFKDEEGIWYYDKDSIHYPFNTKGFLGSIKTDRNILRVWTKPVKNDLDFMLFLVELSCPQREIQTIDNVIVTHGISHHLPGSTSIKRTIPPGSWEEKLFNEVCK